LRGRRPGPRPTRKTSCRKPSWNVGNATAARPAVARVHHDPSRAIDFARREDRRANREQVVALDESQLWFDVDVENRELSRVIQNALAELPVEQREVITLKVWGEMTFAEIADALGIPANTAASRYRYGLSELRRLTNKC
jgi:RNA polymerase sigma factor (sigma-70 family)